jgi:hypothetical protein
MTVREFRVGEKKKASRDLFFAHPSCKNRVPTVIVGGSAQGTLQAFLT